MVQTPSLHYNQFDRFEMATNQLLQEMGALKQQETFVVDLDGLITTATIDQRISTTADQ